MDGRRLHGDGHHRRAVVLRDSRALVSEHLFPHQGHHAGARRRQCLDLPDRHSPPHRGVGSAAEGAASGAPGRHRVPRALGHHHRFRPDDRLQLVRLRQTAAVRFRELGHRLRRREESELMLWSFFQWCEATSLGTAIRTSPWAFAVIESVHLLGLSVIGGAVLLVDLRLLGLGLKNQRVADVARATDPWFVGSLAVMLVTGIALFLSESTKCYGSAAFWVKMRSLALAMIFAFTIRRRVTLADETRVRPIWFKLVALVSLALWFGVGAGGRWIGFS